MAAIRLGINGFGRIGRLVVRALLESDRPIDIVAINDQTSPEVLAHLFQRDSVHGRFPGHVEVADGDLVIDGDRLRITTHPEPSDLPWRELEPHVVIESTGHHNDRAGLEAHLAAGASRVLLSAPGDADVTIVPGVNDEAFDADEHLIVSTASCTTNCLAPVLKIVDGAFGVEWAYMTTVHAYTNDQRLLDGPHKDLRRARSAALSMIPTSTGAARAIGKVLPALDGKVDGLAVRVPTPDVSLIDVTARLGSSVDQESLAAALREGADALSGILRCEEQPLVSADIIGDPHSAIVDMPSLMASGEAAKILAWYDNEWGYANRVAEMVHRLADAGSA